MTHKMAAVCLCAVLLGGCSSVNVVKNPSPADNGIRYYRPKPYLLVTPADATGRMVKLEVLQLPDYCEEYSIHPKGKKPPAVQLKDGWNLVGVGGPAPAASPEPPPAAPPTDPLKLPEAVLVAGNVPIGLYESVFDYAGPVKFLKGWRYVGFSPWGGGLPNGTDAQALANVRNGCPPCVGPGSVIQGPLYGIVFFNGAMTFRQIDEIANNMTCPTYVKPPTGSTAPTGITPVPVTPPSGSGIEAVPTAPAPRTPPPTTFSAPVPRPLPLDAGVRQTSSTTRRPAAQVVTTTKTVIPPPKTVDPNRLQALEAEVFKSLNYSPAAGAAPTDGASGSLVPNLTPATPIR